VFGVDVSTGASADAPLASANKPAAPKMGMVLRLRFRMGTRFACAIGNPLDYLALSHTWQSLPQCSVPVAQAGGFSFQPRGWGLPQQFRRFAILHRVILTCAKRWGEY
jgi:hypothetical protein